METTTIYRVTYRGLEQIREWLLYEWCCDAEDVGDLDAAVCHYASRAEQSQDGEIELRARETASGRPAYLKPEREQIEVEL